MKNSLENSLYHSFLRVAVSVCALVLVFDSGLLFHSTAGISNLVQQNVANVVGVTVGVAPNDVNVLTGRITELETELKAKERLIAVNNANNNQTDSTPDNSTFILSAILFILLVLIVLNYTLDYLRSRKETPQYEKTTSSMA